MSLLPGDSSPDLEAGRLVGSKDGAEGRLAAALTAAGGLGAPLGSLGATWGAGGFSRPPPYEAVCGELHAWTAWCLQSVAPAAERGEAGLQFLEK